MAVRSIAVDRPHRTSIWPWLHPLPAGPGMAESPWAAGRWPAGPRNGGFLGLLAEWLGMRFAVVDKPGSQILGEALVMGVVLGWQAVLVLVPLALLLEELSRIARCDGDRCAASWPRSG